jgi:hypothetical protein
MSEYEMLVPSRDITPSSGAKLEGIYRVLSGPGAGGVAMGDNM